MNHSKVPRHFIGGIALTNGVLLHTTDTAVLAFRNQSGEIITKYWKLPPEKVERSWLKLFGIRGIWLLWRSIVWNGRARSFVDVVGKQSRIAASLGKNNQEPEQPSHPTSLFPIWGVVVAILVYLDFVVLISTIDDWVRGDQLMFQSDFLTFVLTSGLVGYLIFKLGIWEYMGYHGAEHQAIHAYEDGKHTNKDLEKYWPYQIRCGAAVVSYVAIGLIILGFILPSFSFFGLLISVIILFSLSYELVMLVDRYHGEFWAVFFSLPGVLLQLIVARKPSLEQGEVAAVALSELTKHSEVIAKRSKQIEEVTLT